MKRCVDPSAPVVQCVICGADVHTCEREEPVTDDAGFDDYCCPAHPDGAEVAEGIWVCSLDCDDELERRLEIAIGGKGS